MNLARPLSLCGLLLLAPALPACAPKASNRAETQERLPPQVSLFGVRLRTWSGSELSAQGRAAKLTYDRQSTRFVASEGQLLFPESKGPSAAGTQNPDLELRAPVVEGETQTRQARGSGGVTVRSSTGLRGRTPSATFDGNALVARSTERVEAEGPGYVLDAGGFTFYFVTDELVFDGPVTSSVEEVRR